MLCTTVALRLKNRPQRKGDGKQVARHKWIAEVLRHGFKLRKSEFAQVRAFLRILFSVRDLAVHPSAKPAAPALRTDLNKGVDWRFVQFSARNARNAFDDTVRLFQLVFARTRDTEPTVRDWAQGSARYLERVSEAEAVAAVNLEGQTP